jgi:hypothetical protein
VTHVAMESTGMYWKPVFNLLEGEFEVLLDALRTLIWASGTSASPGDAARSVQRSP